MNNTEDKKPGSLKRMIRARRMITEAGGVWLKLELRITARLHIGLGLVTCMKGVPHPWWKVRRTDRISPDGLFGEATTVSMWRLRIGWWRASRPNE